MAAKQVPSTAGVALIGAGMIAPTHITALSALGDRARLRAIVSRDPAKAQHLSTLYAPDTPTFTADLAAVAADPAIQVAIVATPPSVRAEVIAPLVAAGTHILLEKPVGRTPQEAREIVELCKAGDVTLGVLFQHRVRASAIAAAQHLASGKLGNLGVAEIAVPLWRDQSYYDELGRGTYARDGGGVMITNAIHSIDLALSLTGPVTGVQAMTATSPLHRMKAEDFAVAGLKFACGAVGSLTASTAVFPHRTEVLRLHFEHASLRIDKDALVVNWRDGRVETIADDTHETVGKHIWHQAVISDFIDAIQEGRKPLVSGQEALVSQDLIAAIEASSRDGQPVDL